MIAILFSLVLMLFGSLPAMAQDQEQEALGPNRQKARDRKQIENEGPTGPMRVELLALFDNRSWAPGRQPPNSLQFQAKITGERLPQIRRAGKVIMEELVTDTGENLIKPDQYLPRDADATQPVYITGRTVRQGFLPRGEEFLSPTRLSQKISRAKGYIPVVLATSLESVVVRNPLQYAGKEIPDPLLERIGVKIRVLSIGEQVELKADPERGIALDFVAGKEKVADVGFYDDWLRKIPTQGRKEFDQDEGGYAYYEIRKGQLDEDTMLVLNVFPEVDVMRIPFEFTDVPLP